MNAANLAAPNLADTVLRMKVEVLHDIFEGTVPKTVASFEDLHDHVDANYYGGFLEDAFSEALVDHFGGRDEHEGLPQGMVEFIDAAQGAIDAWIVSGECFNTASGR